MNYPLDTPAQAQAVLKTLRAARGLSQAQLGELMGVNQKRIARIESAPGSTSLAQMTKLVALLGGRLVVADAPADAKPSKPTW